MRKPNHTKCLVTGGAGFIGSHLVDVLLAQGYSVRVLDNLVNGRRENLAHHLESQQVDLHQGSITDPIDVARSMKGIDVVFHLAALGVRHSIVHPFENHRVNAEGTLLVLAAAHRAGVKRFIHCSSSEVYGSAQTVPMSESHPTRPATIYGGSKLAGEAYARAYHLTYGLPIVIIRPFNTYGPRSHFEGDAGEMIPKSIVRALNGQPLLVFGDGLQTRDFTYVTDTARGLAAAAENDKMVGMTLNIGSNFEISIKDLAQKILEYTGRPNDQVRYTAQRPGDVWRLYADTTQFFSLCSWRPAMDFNKGLAQTVEAFRTHPLGLKGLMAKEAGRSWEADFS
jgi:UDP-glucose 4-epimerase